MSGALKSIVEAVGRTPLVEYRPEAPKAYAKIRVKLEYLNPWGSLKDRTALKIIEDAERTGRLRPGMTVVEATSGNTGISLAAICAAKGYEVIIFMPEFVSEERKLLLGMLGAQLVLTATEFGLAGPVAKCQAYADEHPDVFVADQTRNPSNPAAHHATGAEIWEQTDGNIDLLVAASGTGGHLSGIGQFLKARKPGIRIVAVEPTEAAILSGRVTSENANPNHGIIGIGPGFIPQTLDRKVIDEVVVIDVEKAYATARHAIRKNGLLIGTSSGAVLHAAEILAQRPEHEGKSIVAIAASASERYLSTKLAQEARAYVAGLQPVAVEASYMDKVKAGAAANK